MQTQTMSVTAKIQLSVSSQDGLLLDRTMLAYRDACNYVSEYIFKTGAELKLSVLQEALYATIRERFGLKAQMTQSVFKTVIAKYRTIDTSEKEKAKTKKKKYKKKAKNSHDDEVVNTKVADKAEVGTEAKTDVNQPTEDKSKDKKYKVQPVFRKPQYDLVWFRDYSLTEDTFSLNTLEGRIKLPYFAKGHAHYFDKSKYSFGTAKVVKKKGKYFLHIAINFDVQVCEREEIRNIVGIDRGINFVVTTYDSNGKTGFVDGRKIKQKRVGFVTKRQSLQAKGTPSSRRRLKAIGQRENRWINDVNHCISKALVEQNPIQTLFVLEDLTGIRAATEKVRVKDRYVMASWSFYDLEQKLIYKAQRKGQQVLKVSPKYTSLCCPHCGHTDKGNRNKRLHLFTCQHCGYCSNDDRIGAMNLYRMGMTYWLNGIVADTVTTAACLLGNGVQSITPRCNAYLDESLKTLEANQPLAEDEAVTSSCL